MSHEENKDELFRYNSHCDSACTPPYEIDLQVKTSDEDMYLIIKERLSGLMNDIDNSKLTKEDKNRIRDFLSYLKSHPKAAIVFIKLIPAILSN